MPEQLELRNIRWFLGHLWRWISPYRWTAILMLAALVTGFLVGNHGTTRKSQVASGTNQVEILRSELYVVDFVEEDNTLLTNY